MRHNIWKKYLKILCSWILILSICFLSLNVVVEAMKPVSEQQSETEETIDIGEQSETEDSADQITDLDAPE